jgi:hypothetical protein
MRQFYGIIFACSIITFLGSGAANAVAATPPPKPTPAPAFSYGGFVRGYYFTRQNASGAPQTFKAINQATFNTAISLHAQYTFPDSPITVGGTYLYANPLNGCNSPVSHLSLPCGKETFTGQSTVPTNPDDTLPGFVLSTLYEAYIQYKGPALYVKVGDQVITTPWANPSDSRLKPVAFEGGDLTYKFNKSWTGEVAYMDRFESRASSAFDNATLLTSHPVDAPGVAANIFTPGGSSITTSGFGYARLGFTGNFAANLHYYAFMNIANALWADAKYAWGKSFSKPFIAMQIGSEQNAGSAVIGKISSTVFGIQAGISPWKNVDFTLGYNVIPERSDTLMLPAGVSCSSSKHQISTASGVTFPYFLPSGGTANCIPNSDGTTTVYYGGWASPYTDSYATDVLFTTSISQGLIDRRSPGQGVKLAVTLQTADHRGRFIASRALYSYGNNTTGTQPTQETNLDGTWFFRKPGTGPYHGFLLRHRYAERTQNNTLIFGGTPLFKYNRTQLEFDF